MSGEIKDVVPTEPEQTTPDPEVAPPAVTPPDNSGVSQMIQGLQEQINGLTETVNGILNNASVEPDSTPVKKPWTHWGS
jgi:hypothetical protein